MSRPQPLASPQPWDLVAPAYADEVVPMFELFAREALRLAAPPPGARVVDVACGPGTLAVLAARAGLVVDALDFSPGMLDRLTTRRGELPITARVGDGQDLPYANDAFAAGFSMFGLMFFPNRAKGFAELRRVLAPGARAVVSSWPHPREVPALAAMFGAVGQASGQQPPPADAPPPALSTPELFQAEMGASFADVEVHRVTQVQRASSVDEMWASMERTMAPLVTLRRVIGEEKWTGVTSAARAALRRVLGDGDVALEMPALLGLGVAR